MCNIQQATSFIFCVQAYNYFYTFSHVVIHLYHFAYLTVDITFVVDNVDQLKPLSEPFSDKVLLCIPATVFLFIIHPNAQQGNN